MGYRGKKYYFIVGGIFLISVMAAGGLGFFIGNQHGTPAESISQPFKAEERKTEKTRLIAIVNQDTGVISNNSTINYAARLLTDPGENFKVTGLEDARTGIENGTYGAYIIIPSSFSSDVVSLNDTPQKAKIEFAVNANLDNAVKEDVVLEMMAFINGMNHNLTYMYVNTLLKEFHSTQDAAVKVMENDKADKEVILRIRPENLVELVTIPELREVEDHPESLDVQQFMEKNKELIETVDNQYAQYIAMSRTDYEALSLQGNELMEEWNQMDSLIENINLVQDETGTAVYSGGVQEAGRLIDAHNSMLAGTSLNISSNTEASVAALNQIKTGYLDQINEYNADIQNYIAQVSSLENLYDDMDLLKDEKLSQFIKELNFEYLPYEDSGELSEWESKWQGRVEILVRYLNNREEYIESQNQYISELESNLKEGVSIQPPQDVLLYSPDIDELSKAGYDSEEAFLSDVNQPEWIDSIKKEVIEKPVNKDALQKELETFITGNTLPKDDFTGKITAAAENFQLYVDKIMISDEEGIQQESSAEQQLGSVITGLQDNVKNNLIEPFHREDMETVVNDQIVNPLIERTDVVTGDIRNRYDTEKEQYTAYNKLLGEYDPLQYINQNEISDTVSRMQENGAGLQDEVSNHDKTQSQYVSDVYKTTRENIDLLSKSIEEANQKSEEAVRNGLADAQEIKDTNSEVNQSLLYDITQKLPYTRLGSLEYMKAYEFIANPLEVVRKSSEGEKKVFEGTGMTDPIDKKEEKTNKGMKDLVTVLAVITGTLLLILVSYLINKIRYRESRES